MSRSSGFVTKKVRLSIYIRDKFTCVYCNKHIKDGCMLSLDHIVPESLGGLHNTTNLVTACHSCNSKRQNKSVRSFAGTTIARKVNRRSKVDMLKSQAKAHDLLSVYTYDEILDHARLGRI